MSGADEDEQIEIDCDACTAIELSQLFDESMRIASEEAISLEKDYILHLDSSRDFHRIAAVTSSRMVHIFDLNGSNGLTQLHRCDTNTFTLKDHLPICGARFANENPNTLFIGEADGNIYMYDIRLKPDHVQTIHADTIRGKAFKCFDLNANDSILCAGTEHMNDEACLVLFDLRKFDSTLATYTDGHSNDLTQIQFHPSKPNVMASGSVDGLINVFNVTETDEDDALEYCLNTESSVQTINWHLKGDMQLNDDRSSDLLSCITDTNGFQLYDVEESEMIFQVDRKQIMELIKRKVDSECYLVNCHNAFNGEVFLLAGSNANGGECLRSLTMHEKSFKPQNNYVDNKQIIRCSLFNSKDNVLITAGEGGIVTVWANVQSSKMDNNKLKEKIKTKDNRKSKPY